MMKKTDAIRQSIMQSLLNQVKSDGSGSDEDRRDPNNIPRTRTFGKQAYFGKGFVEEKREVREKSKGRKKTLRVPTIIDEGYIDSIRVSESSR